MNADASGNKRPIVLITGGGGFLGRALVRELLFHTERHGLDSAEIRVFDVRPEGVFDHGLEPDPRLNLISADVRDRPALMKACTGVDVVIHCAAIVDWGCHREEEIRAVNVDGTHNVITACTEQGVAALVHTSTEDVVYTGESIRDGNEHLPYAKKHITLYCETKTLAERAARAANGARSRHTARNLRSKWIADRHHRIDCGLKTTCLRPVGMFGEGDPFHLSSLMRMAQKGLLFRIGDGKALFQHVYVGNVAHALALAAHNLIAGPGLCAGECYFITDFAPANFFDYLEPIITGAGFRMHPKRLSLPRPLMYGLGWLMETTARMLKPIYPFTPTVSRFGVTFVCTDFTFRTEKAKKHFGYTPVYAEDEVFRRTTEWFRTHGPV
jgi:nucleoside-diphosphate-sugar epimerase